jgi:hypothetical protein
MREIRSSGSVEGVMSNHDPYSDRKRRSDSILASSLACELARDHSEA